LAVFAVLARWSPVGTQIAFTEVQAGRAWTIWLISAQGGAAEEMLAECLICRVAGQVAY